MSPANVVAALGAMQAQDYAGGKWAVGLRAPSATDAIVEAAIAKGEILRTHPMRGTHHFVARQDIRWMIALLGTRSITKFASRWRELGIDDPKLIAKSLNVIARALEGGKQLPRADLLAALERAKISTEGQRGPHLLMRAELEGLVCSGARRGAQITFALLDDRAPSAKPRPRDESLADLATRYFTTRGPASLRDFVWWCALTVADCRAAIELAGKRLVREQRDGVDFWRGAEQASGTSTRAYLIPPYDEYAVAYADRSAIGKPPANAASFSETTLLGPGLVVDGQIVGAWRRVQTKKQVTITLSPWRELTAKQAAAVDVAARRYADFLELPARIVRPD